MYTLLYESKRSSKFAVSAFQTATDEVLILDKSNSLQVLISLHVWKKIISDVNFRCFQFRKNPYTNVMHLVIIYMDKSTIDIYNYVFRLIVKSDYLKSTNLNTVKLRNSNINVEYNKYSNLLDLRITNETSIIITRHINFDSFNYFTAQLNRSYRSVLYGKSINALLENWCKHIKPYTNIGDIHISEITYDNTKYIIDHRANLIPIVQ